MIEVMLICLLMGFILGYFANRWQMTDKIAKFLDRVFDKCDHHK